MRKYVTIFDNSYYAIIMTIWGEMCEKFPNLAQGDIVLVKRARISEFGGKSLNAADDHSIMYVNHLEPKSQYLQNWF